MSINIHMNVLGMKRSKEDATFEFSVSVGEIFFSVIQKSKTKIYLTGGTIIPACCEL